MRMDERMELHNQFIISKDVSENPEDSANI